MENTDKQTLFDLEARVADIVEKSRRETYVFVEEMMWNAFTEIGQCILDCENRSMDDDIDMAAHCAREYSYIMTTKNIAGLTSRTLQGIVAILRRDGGFEKVPADMKPGFLLDFLKARTISFNATRALYPNYLKPWTRDDDDELMRMYADGVPIKKLAVHFGRNEGAIEARIDKLLI